MLHELFLTYVGAGFQQDQALYLVGVFLRTAIQRSPNGE
jgi:hypothetical protein